MHILRRMFEENGCRVVNQKFDYTAILVTLYKQEELPRELVEWIGELKLPDVRRLYWICRNKRVMPEPLLLRLDEIVSRSDKGYIADQKRPSKNRPAHTTEKYILDACTEAQNMTFFLETLKKIREGMTQKAAAGSNNNARKYRKIKKEHKDWEGLNTDNIPEQVNVWFESML